MYKTFYECKRRKPQPIRSESAIYRDPYNRKLKQFSTASNDGFLNGGDPFTVLFNLHNVDDKAIVPAWLSKPPSIKWSINTETNVLSGNLVLHLDIQGEQAGQYALKYTIKPDQKKLPEGDTLIAAMAHLEPRNAVTTGTFTRMYNKISEKGPQPIFQAIHSNIKLPFVSKPVPCWVCLLLRNVLTKTKTM